MVGGRRPTGAKGHRIRLGMVGGGHGGFIGAVHRYAARLDDQYDLVAGALSSDPKRARESGESLGLAPERIYSDFMDMARIESGRDDGIEAVAIVTPNHLHVPVASAFIGAGIHVICDKPLARSLEEAEGLASLLAQEPGVIFALTHNYSGYPMVRQARAMIAEGALGTIRVVQVEYPQDWLTQPIECDDQKQAAWRTDPLRSGIGGSIADIGTHAFQLATFVTGLAVEEVAADLCTFVEGRRLDDNAHVMLRFKGGARGMLFASQICPGNQNALSIRVYGSQGGLSWHQEDPDRLRHSPFARPEELLTRGGPQSHPSSLQATRLPPGHPEGYLEGFANLYKDVAAEIRRRQHCQPSEGQRLFPGIEDGISGMAFIEACVRSSSQNSSWTKLDFGSHRQESQRKAKTEKGISAADTACLQFSCKLVEDRWLSSWICETGGQPRRQNSQHPTQGREPSWWQKC